MGRMEPNHSLYSRKVLIEGKSKNVLPDFLRFVHGVVRTCVSIAVQGPLCTDFDAEIGGQRRHSVKHLSRGYARQCTAAENFQRDYKTIAEAFRRSTLTLQHTIMTLLLHYSHTNNAAFSL